MNYAKQEVVTNIIKPSDVYKEFGLWPVTQALALKAMAGYKVVAFRPVLPHETFLSKAGIVKVGWTAFEPTWKEYDGGPRFILEPLNPEPSPSIWE